MAVILSIFVIYPRKKSARYLWLFVFGSSSSSHEKWYTNYWYGCLVQPLSLHQLFWCVDWKWQNPNGITYRFSCMRSSFNLQSDAFSDDLKFLVDICQDRQREKSGEYFIYWPYSWPPIYCKALIMVMMLFSKALFSFAVGSAWWLCDDDCDDIIVLIIIISFLIMNFGYSIQFDYNEHFHKSART